MQKKIVVCKIVSEMLFGRNCHLSSASDTTVQSNTCSVGKNDVVDRDEDELDRVSNESHHNKAHHAGIHYLQVFLLVGLLALVKEHA